MAHYVLLVYHKIKCNPIIYGGPEGVTEAFASSERVLF